MDGKIMREVRDNSFGDRGQLSFVIMYLVFSLVFFSPQKDEYEDGRNMRIGSRQIDLYCI